MEIKLMPLPEDGGFIAKIRAWLLPEWIADGKQQQKEVKYLSYQPGLRLNTTYERALPSRREGRYYNVHICGICNAITRLEPLWEGTKDSTVYEIGKCHFEDQEWHQTLEGYIMQHQATGNEVEKSRLKQVIRNIYRRYEREIRYYNENDIPRRNNIYE